jgi:phage gp45-like
VSDLAKLLGPMARRVGNLVARGKVLAANSASKMQTLQVALLAGETKDTVEHFEPFGFTSKPLAGAEHVTLFLDGDRSHGVTVVVADRRYRLQGLQDGEVALSNAFGHKVVLGEDFMELSHPVEIRLNTPMVKVSQDMHVAGTLTADVDVISGDKSGKTHTHPTGGGNTGTPNS